MEGKGGAEFLKGVEGGGEGSSCTNVTISYPR